MGTRGERGGVAEGGAAYDIPIKGLNAYCTARGTTDKDNQCQRGNFINGCEMIEECTGNAFRPRSANTMVTVTMLGISLMALASN